MKISNAVVFIVALVLATTLIGSSSPRPAGAKEKEPSREVVILEGYPDYFTTNLSNEAHLSGYSGFRIQNASTSRGAPKIPVGIWLYQTVTNVDGSRELTSRQTNELASLAQSMADLLNEGYQIKQIDTREYSTRIILVK